MPRINGSGFKMKGSPMKRNFGIESPLRDDNKKKSVREEYEEMKEDVRKTGNPAAKLSAKYGGKWSKKGNSTTYTNEEGLKPVQVASALSREKAKEKTKN